MQHPSFAAGAGLVLLALAACSPADPPAVPDAPGERTAPTPAAHEAMISAFRADEDAALRSLSGNAVHRPSWSRLVIVPESGAPRVFGDTVVGEELQWMHAFRGSVEPVHAYVVEKRYVPEGGEFILVDGRTGRTTRLDERPVASPDGERIVTASLDLVAGHAPNRIRIFRMEGDRPVLEWEARPSAWGARDPVWVDARTLRLERAVVDWATHGLRTSPMVLRREAAGWRVQPSPEHAADVLLAFLSALGAKMYHEAAAFYGGPYDVLRAWNPELAPGDLPALWRSACEHNGLQCLGRAEVVRQERISETETRFVVRLYTRSGERFRSGPCCGETEASMPPTSEFPFRVRRDGDRYVVLDLPPYVP